MHKARQMLIAAAALTTWVGAAPAAADVKAGVDAWQARNYTAAVNEWRPLANKGNADAQFNMGQAYKLGRGVPPDLRIAQSWYEKAAQQGHDKAQANLGLILFQEGERAKAMPWIRLAADKGDPRAQYVLGTALFNGDLVAKDWPHAYALTTRAAAAGLPPAADNLKQMDKVIPLADRQKGIALARQIEKGEAPASASEAPPAKTSVSAAPAKKAAASLPNKATVPAPEPKAVASKPAPSAPVGKWRVQLGAYSSADAAREHWAKVSKSITALKGLQPSYQAAGKLTRLRAGPLADKSTAEKVCAAAKAAGQGCFTVAP